MRRDGSVIMCFAYNGTEGNKGELFKGGSITTCFTYSGSGMAERKEAMADV